MSRFTFGYVREDGVCVELNEQKLSGCARRQACNLQGCLRGGLATMLRVFLRYMHKNGHIITMFFWGGWRPRRSQEMC